MDHCDSPLFNNLLKLCDTEDISSNNKVSGITTPISSDGSYCASCVRLWRDRRYYNWGSLYTRSSLCAECQKGQDRQSYISYWGNSKYRVGSWRLRQKWMNSDSEWMFNRTETPRSNDARSRSERSTERSWSQDFTPRSHNSLSQSDLSARLHDFTQKSPDSISRSEPSARSQEFTPRSRLNQYTAYHTTKELSSEGNDTGQNKGGENSDSVDISMNSSQSSFSSLKSPQERRPRSKSPCLQKVNIASRKQMFEPSNDVISHSGRTATDHCSKDEPTAAWPDIPKLNLNDLDVTPYNSPVYHFPLTPKHIPTVAKPNRWVGYGYFVGTAELTSDTGHLLWVRPRGDLQVIFRYADTGQDFKCFVDPQYTGVRLCQRKPDGELVVILDRKESPQHSHQVSSRTRYPPQSNFKLVSYLGRIELILQAVKDNSSPNSQRFKINFTMTL
ncbi:uncharacterized protein LOC110466360 [Mizuhopecten yessoensis]|uniref:Uncharacterized protein n=1 Tax=Mizuhopecten yessoensis TaxID=6573 RepID=A0A210PPM9_MIZYE|nr:uncharacterized protein LOC110466360 [Mizuhopecten yessoensis]OWF38404.1 hypothetical protein KP79_PYT10720 [Mizuhopecten yessoensis]